MQRIALSLGMLEEFRTLFDEYKANLAQFFKAPRSYLPWTFHPNAVFERFNAFAQRLHTIQWFFRTVIEFLRLEKIEVGGPQGRQLSARITAIFVEFNAFFAAFASKSYDVLNPDEPKFEADLADFQARIQELDMKLAAILCQAFDDCHCLDSVFKLISIAGTVLERPKISAEFEGKYRMIVVMFQQEIAACEFIYDTQIVFRREQGRFVVDSRFPQVTAALRWSRQLADRITAPLLAFESLTHPINKTPEALALIERVRVLLKELGAFSEQMFGQWTAKVPDQIRQHLDRPLLARQTSEGSNGVLLQNFHPELRSLLDEVHQMRLLSVENVPAEGLTFAEQSDTYWMLTVNLDKTVRWYNEVVQRSNQFELALIQSEIEEIDQCVKVGMEELTWKSDSK